MSEDRRSTIYDDLVDDKPKKKEKTKVDYSGMKKIKFSQIPVFVHVIFIFLLLFFIIPAGLRFVRGFGAWKEYDYMAGKDFIGDPIQHKLDPDEELYASETIDGYTFKIKKLAEYSVAGRVVNVQDFLGYNAFNKFSPRDFGLAYGLYANKENTKGIFFYSLHDRFLHWHYFGRK